LNNGVSAAIELCMALPNEAALKMSKALPTAVGGKSEIEEAGTL
jgi:hypothetical protein